MHSRRWTIRAPVSAAPLKPDVPALACLPLAHHPRPRERGPVEAWGVMVLGMPLAKPIRAPVSAAPLKRHAPRRRPGPDQPIRAPVSAAPLKHYTRRVIVLEKETHPRPRERGPVEAGRSKRCVFEPDRPSAPP